MSDCCMDGPSAWQCSSFEVLCSGDQELLNVIHNFIVLTFLGFYESMCEYVHACFLYYVWVESVPLIYAGWQVSSTIYGMFVTENTKLVIEFMNGMLCVY